MKRLLVVGVMAGLVSGGRLWAQEEAPPSPDAVPVVGDDSETTLPVAEPVEAEPIAAPEPEPVKAPEPPKPPEKPKPTARLKILDKLVEPSAPAADPAEAAKAGLAFLQTAVRAAAPEVYPTLLEQLELHLQRFRDVVGADQAQFLKAEVHEKQGDATAAVIDTLKLIHEYPRTKLEFSAKKKLMELADKKFRRQKAALAELMKAPDPKLDRADRFASLLRAVAGLQDKELTVPLLAELGDFLRRYPGHPAAGEIEFLQARVLAVSGNNAAAILIYEKILALSKDEDLGARAQSAIADTYASALKSYEKAVEAYQAVTDRFASHPEAGAAYVKWAKILDENLKQPALAMEIMQKAAALYPGTEAEHQSLLDQSKLLKEKLGDPAGAVERLEKLADTFKDDRSVDALNSAAAIAGSPLKDFVMQARLWERLASEYPDHKAAPQALWDAGQVYESPLADLSAARKAYQKLVGKYVGNALAKKAAKRITTLDK